MVMFCVGGWDYRGWDYVGSLDSILQFDGETEQWEDIGKLRTKRFSHAASVININKIAAYLKCD